MSICRFAMRTSTLALCITALFLSCEQAAAAPGDPIGSAVVVVNLVTAQLEKSDQHKLATGDDVRQEELIEVSSDGKGELKLRDETKLALGPGARLRLDQFVYDPDLSGGAIVLNLVKGSFRFITGLAAKPAYVIRTPTASITVRGTIFDIYVQSDGMSWLLLIEGALQACNENGKCQVHDQPCKLIRITPGGDVGVPVKWTGLPGKQEVAFDTAFPFVVNAPVIDPNPICTRDAIVEPERCPDGTPVPKNGRCPGTTPICDPGPNEYRNDDGRCVCRSGYERNDRGLCVAEEAPLCDPGPNEYRNDDGRCVCRSGYERNSRGLCVAEEAPLCKPGKNEYRNDDGRCVCKSGHERDNRGRCVEKETPLCEPGPNEHRDEGRCVCLSGFVHDDQGRCVRTPPPPRLCPPNSDPDSKYPNCRCARGFTGMPPNCRPIVQECRRDQVGKWPNCRDCRPGTHADDNECVPDHTPPPRSCPPNSDPDSKYPNCRCARGFTGTPPNCRRTDPVCKRGERFLDGKCVRTPDPVVCGRGSVLNRRTGRCEPLAPPPPIRCRNGYTGTPPNCRPIVRDCPRGMTGTPPNCRPLVIPTCPRGTIGIFPNCKTIQIR